MLYVPRGIFVDRLFNFYVADCGNNRIQFFQSGNLNGTTVAGVAATGTISLQCPTGVVLDGGGYLFIVDGEHHRVVGQSSNGFRCVVGCTNTSGSASNQLSLPRSLSFDSYGNIYVVDRSNNRVQLFFLENNTCGEFFMGETGSN
jgi:DNA-binding beta-propeller fold protein YncE